MNVISRLVRPLNGCIYRSSATRALSSGAPSGGFDEETLVLQAIAGDKESAVVLGSHYFKQTEYPKARPWLELAAEMGDTESAFMMALLLQEEAKQAESEGEASNAQEVIQEIKDARKEARNARKEKRRETKKKGEDTMVVSSKDDTSSEETDSAVFWLRKAAKEGHESAMVLLANNLIEEEDIISKQEALKLYRKAADMDHPDALFNLGTLHFNGIEGVLESNEENSLPFFEKAASLGDEASLYWVGHCYLSGEGGVTTRNSQQAMTYLQSAAEKGHVGAHYHLAVIYRNGVDAIPTDKKLFLSHHPGRGGRRSRCLILPGRLLYARIGRTYPRSE